MKIPDELKAQLQTLEERLVEVNGERERIRRQEEDEIALVRRRYRPKKEAAGDQYHQISDEVKQLWERIRKEMPLEHPVPKQKFRTSLEAAEVLAAYWLGAEMPSEVLLSEIMGIGTSGARVYADAARYATQLTEHGSPERKYVEKAEQFLWKDYRR